MKTKKTKVNILEGGIGSSPSFNERVKAPALIETKEPEITFRQPRSYLKTTAKLVGKDTSNEPTLFSLPTLVKEDNNSDNIRRVISKNTSILGQVIFNLWQLNKNEEEELEITNLSELSSIMKQTNFEIKMYLLYLGGYTYPCVELKEKKVCLSIEQLFKVTFEYGEATRERYIAGGSEYIGNEFTSFIKDEKVDLIRIKPNIKFINEIAGAGLGNLRVTDKFIKLALGLTDIAYKLLNYTSSNVSPLKISESNIILWLGLEKQLKSQGRPRIRETILKGLAELQSKDHLKDYKIDSRDIFTITSSDKFTRRKENKGLIN